MKELNSTNLTKARLFIEKEINILDADFDWMIILELQDAISCLERAKKELKEKEPLHIHTFEYIGHNHNDDVYKCTLCGKLEYR